MESHLPHAAAAPASRGATSTSPGTSPSRARRSLPRRMLSIRDDAFAELGDRNLADLQGPGRVARRSRSTRSPTTPSAAGSRTCAAPRRGPRSTVPCYLDQPGCPPGLALPPRTRTACPCACPATPTQAQLHLQHPALGHARRPRRGPSLYGHGLFGDAARSRPTTSSSSATSTTCSSARADWVGMAERGHPQRDHGPAGPLELPDARRPPPAGLPQLPVPRAGADPPGRLRRRPGVPAHGRPLIDTRRALLRRQQPGRDHRRRADRGRARLHPRGALRAAR